MRPSTGLTILFICASVIRGGKNPCVVEVTSNSAELTGVVAPTPILPVEVIEIPSVPPFPTNLLLAKSSFWIAVWSPRLSPPCAKACQLAPSKK